MQTATRQFKRGSADALSNRKEGLRNHLGKIIIGLAVIVMAFAAMAVSNVMANECEFGLMDPDNPLNPECRAVPEDLGKVTIELGVVADFGETGYARCTPDHRFVFADERLNGELIRKVEVKFGYSEKWDSLDYGVFTTNLSTGLSSIFGLGDGGWSLSNLERNFPNLTSLAAHPQSQYGKINPERTVWLHVEDAYSGVWNKSTSAPILADDFAFNWKAALVACAQQHRQMEAEAEAAKAIKLDKQASDSATETLQFIADSEIRIAQYAIDHYTAEIAKLEAASAKLEETLAEARGLYQEALAQQRRTIELRTRMTEAMADYFADKEKEYLAFSAWADNQLATQHSNLSDMASAIDSILEVQSEIDGQTAVTNAKIEDAKSILEEALGGN